MAKRELYKTFLDRMTSAHVAGMSLQASWYAYAILEDRLVSLLMNTGGATKADGKPIGMMGTKLSVLTERARRDELLNANLDTAALRQWAKARNKLMHGMADGSLSIEQIDLMAAQLAEDGMSLARTVAAAAARVKRHRAKVSQGPTVP